MQRGWPLVEKTAIAFEASSATRMIGLPLLSLPALMPIVEGKWKPQAETAWVCASTTWTRLLPVSST